LVLTALRLLFGGLTLTWSERFLGGKMMLIRMGCRRGLRWILGALSVFPRSWPPITRGLLRADLGLLRLGGCGRRLGGRFA
jgi:hypothetical protein